MKVRVVVEYFGQLRPRMPQPEESLVLGAGQTLQDLFDQLAMRHGSAFTHDLLAPRGEPLPNVVLTVAGRRVADREGMNRPLDDGTVVRVLQMPPFTGGG